MCISAIFMFQGCSEKDAAPDLPLSHSEKGWEIYSWSSGGSQWFSLLPGTNRVKSYDEVVGGPVTVRGMENLTGALGTLPEGEVITLIGPQWLQQAWGSGYRDLGLPPASMIAEIESFCLSANLVFGVAE